MATLGEQEIKVFQALYTKHFGVRLSREQALEHGTTLVALMRQIYKPVTKDMARRHLASRET